MLLSVNKNSNKEGYDTIANTVTDFVLLFTCISKRKTLHCKKYVIVCVYFFLFFMHSKFFSNLWGFFNFRIIFFCLESDREDQEIKLVWPLTNLFVEQDLRNKNEKPLEKIEDKILKNPIDHFLECQTKWTDYYIKPVYIFFIGRHKMLKEKYLCK